MSNKTKLSSAEVGHIAKLANLSLSNMEVEKFREQLSEALNYVEILKEIDTSSISPTSQVTGTENVFREDEIKPSLKLKKGFFKA